MAYRTYVKGKVSDGMHPGEKGFTLYDDKGTFMGSGAFSSVAIKENRLEVMIRGKRKGEFLVHFTDAGGLGFFGYSSYWGHISLITREAS